MFNEDTFIDCALYAPPPCHLVLSTRRVLAAVLTSLRQCFLSIVTSLSYASFIPVTSCISSIHFLLGRPLLLLPALYASIIPFSNPPDRITCPKNPSFLLSAVCCSVSSSSNPISIPISLRTLSLVFFSIPDILCIFLHIYISHALIFFPIFFVIVHISQPYRTFSVSMFACLSLHNFSNSIIVAFPIANLRLISLSGLPSFSTSDPRNIKLVTTILPPFSFLHFSLFSLHTAGLIRMRRRCNPVLLLFYPESIAVSKFCSYHC